ncbi:PKD-like domain-containing protein [Proteiniphilum sp.]|uniref:PKD-like domain-containing protein n=1 Tax=Proteiniphilum sp. TaxID=1926877 RepID=UPI002B20F286|nr:PKD-like domain-containing protein [Proteiniphilum sp.]MEA4918276.1 PKD-like domain-containing protein [Proteiniphilum sp.]
MNYFFKLRNVLWLFVCLTAFFSCSDDDPAELVKPQVSFSSETGEYKVKAGKSITLEPVVENAVNPVYSWKLDGKIISTDKTYEFSTDKQGEYFITFRVDAENGFDEKQVKISVLDKLPPQINLKQSFAGFVNEDVEIAPEIENPEGVTYEWLLNGKVIGKDPVLKFNQNEVASYQLILSATNEDGIVMAATSVVLLIKPEPALFFDDGKYRTAENRKVRLSVPFGRSLVLAPVKVIISDKATYQWSVDGAVQSGVTKDIFTFKPAEQKTYKIKVTATDGEKIVSGEVDVECVKPEGAYYRPATATSMVVTNQSFGFVQAPGQFVSITVGTTEVQQTQKATDAIKVNTGGWCFSLGAFGGYVIMGFDHSVDNVPDVADLEINGNAFVGWSEPGIIYVMQDENGNGLPDDMWYELKGSVYGTKQHIARYALTYFRPKGNEIFWVDNLGNTGAGSALSGGITKYPNFVPGDRVTFVGTCLQSTMNEGGIITNPGYDWGYVDNVNSRTGFYIEDAVQADGTPANLKYIDFVKVHTGMNVDAKILGEVSTETSAAFDLHLKNK